MPTAKAWLRRCQLSGWHVPSCESPVYRRRLPAVRRGIASDLARNRPPARCVPSAQRVAIPVAAMRTAGRCGQVCGRCSSCALAGRFTSNADDTRLSALVSKRAWLVWRRGETRSWQSICLPQGRAALEPWVCLALRCVQTRYGGRGAAPEDEAWSTEHHVTAPCHDMEWWARHDAGEAYQEALGSYIAYGGSSLDEVRSAFCVPSES